MVSGLLGSMHKLQTEFTFTKPYVRHQSSDHRYPSKPFQETDLPRHKPTAIPSKKNRCCTKLLGGRNPAEGIVITPKLLATFPWRILVKKLSHHRRFNVPR